MKKLLYVIRKLLGGGYGMPQHEPGSDPNCPFCQEMNRKSE